MINILAIAALVFALLCVAAWYNQPERYEFIGVPDDYKCPDCERMANIWGRAWLALGKAARDASIVTDELRGAIHGALGVPPFKLTGTLRPSWKIRKNGVNDETEMR